MSEQLSAWPTTDEVRATFSAQDRLAFDRWLVQHGAQVKEEAWDEGVLVGLASSHSEDLAEPNPYRIESPEDESDE